jgi:hypothetical protein
MEKVVSNKSPANTWHQVIPRKKNNAGKVTPKTGSSPEAGVCRGMESTLFSD